MFDNEYTLRSDLKKIPENRRAEYNEAGISDEWLLELLKNGWTPDILSKGYVRCEGDSEVDIPHAIQIQSIYDLGFYETDDEAREQAALDGVALINDIPELEKGVYVDTPENRKICTEALEKNPELRIANILKSASDEYRKSYIEKYGEPDGYKAEDVQQAKKVERAVETFYRRLDEGATMMSNEVAMAMAYLHPEIFPRMLDVFFDEELGIDKDTVKIQDEHPSIGNNKGIRCDITAKTVDGNDVVLEVENKSQ